MATLLLRRRAFGGTGSRGPGAGALSPGVSVGARVAVWLRRPLPRFMSNPPNYTSALCSRSRRRRARRGQAARRPPPRPGGPLAAEAASGSGRLRGRRLGPGPWGEIRTDAAGAAAAARERAPPPGPASARGLPPRGWAWVGKAGLPSGVGKPGQLAWLAEGHAWVHV